MKLATAAGLLRSGQAGVLLSLQRLLKPYYRVCFLGAAAGSGLLRRLAGDPVSLDRLAMDLAVAPGERDGLEAWLDLGVSLGELRRSPTGYALRGRLARALAEPAHDPAAALVEEVATLHQRWVTEAPRRLRERRLLSLDDLRGDLIARSSRTLEAFIGDAVEAVVPARGPVRLFEIGCGSAIHIRSAAAHNPELTALGIDLAPDVVALAGENVRAWGLTDRVRIEQGDVLQRASRGDFDLATLHNNVYYFPVDRRVPLLAHVRSFLRPHGCLLLTTACQGGGPTTQILNLWGALTAGCGRLPGRDELTTQLEAAGFTAVRAWRLIPMESFYAFQATA